MMSSLFGF